MSAETSRAMDDAIRAHMADEYPGGVAVAWVLAAGIMGSDDVDYATDSAEGQPGYVTVGLANMLVTHITGNVQPNGSED